eukprot:scaffold21250_cov111-Isochrysis_galbana.AAC.2
MPPSRHGAKVSDATVVSRWSCTYSRSARSSCSSLSASLFLPTPWSPRSSRCPPPSHSSNISRRRATCPAMGTNEGEGTSDFSMGDRRATDTSPMLTRPSDS